MNKKSGAIWIFIGVAFILNAILGRYVVVPGYLSSLEAGRQSVAAASQIVPVWKVIRYVLWAYSFKLGFYFLGIGVLLKASISSRCFWAMAIGGIVYLALAYTPVPGPFSLFFGIGGTIISILLVLIFIRWAREYGHLAELLKIQARYRLIGYFFFAMATYNLCPLMGVKAFGLYPEKMIQFGLQSEAASFASRIMIELVLGWSCIFLSHRGWPRSTSSSSGKDRELPLTRMGR